MIARELKFRQAAIAYLIVGVLYEGAALAMLKQGILPDRFGPPWVWLVVGAAIVGAVVWGLWQWQNVWFARIIWVVHAARIPTLIGGAFFPAEGHRLGPAFYGTALFVVVVNLWMLARAAWDI